MVKYIGKKGRLIPNFIEVKKYPQSNAARHKVVLFLGSVGKSKGISELTDAWKKVRPPGWTLRLVGPLAPSYDTESWRGDLDTTIELVGPLDHDQAMHLMRQAALLVLPSHTEGFPNVVLEGMATGTPVLASNVGAIPTMLADGAGCVVPARNSSALANALTDLTSDKQARDRMASLAVAKVNQQYSPGPVMRQYREVWFPHNRHSDRV
ncbi:glycosyltransferase family 4 protein [Ornithinimicrobium sp. LYQ103]|uniref:glycosyltransferase family 4 protein n=1 Tax=Ornithinimicrobium sp. LYQ103 TaxID=3378796 RepID=UPI0038546BE4